MGEEEEEEEERDEVEFTTVRAFGDVRDNGEIEKKKRFAFFLNLVVKLIRKRIIVLKKLEKIS